MPDLVEAWKEAAEACWLACRACGSPPRREEALAKLKVARELEAEVNN